MRKLIIKNIGPIKYSEITLNKVNILIGPQSNGKSTIAKIISSCLWIEKKACTTLSLDVVKDGDQFKQLIEDFHRIHGYIHSDSSVVKYTSPYISIVYNQGEFSMTFQDYKSYRRKKISYIPSDRNVITMRDIEKRELEPNNFRSFLFDWLKARRHYDKNHKVPILNLGVRYFCNENMDSSRMDTIFHENGLTYEIPLYDASSGLQSLVPLTVLMHYLVSDYFEDFGKETSFESEQQRIQIAWKVSEVVTSHYFPKQVAQEDVRSVYQREIKNKADNNDPVAEVQLKEIKDWYARLVTPQSISFILEEPEQNLFPSTQYELVKQIVAAMNFDRGDTLLLTTHSPYVMTSINNLIQAANMATKNAEKAKEVIPQKSWLNYKDVSAWAVNHGTTTSINDNDFHLLSSDELDKASDEISDDFSKLISE